MTSTLWVHEARCAGITNFVDYDPKLRRAFCDGCPVKKPCHAAGMRTLHTPPWVPLSEAARTHREERRTTIVGETEKGLAAAVEPVRIARGLGYRRVADLRKAMRRWDRPDLAVALGGRPS